MRTTDEFLVFSDLHAHNFKFGSKRVPHDVKKFSGLYNSRLMDAVHVLKYIKKYAKDHAIEHVVFGGDLFHRRAIQHTDAYNLITHELYQMADAGIYLNMIPGNHDYADRRGQTHVLQAIRHERISVCDRVDWHVLGPTDASTRPILLTVPYTDDIEEAKRRLEEAGEIASALNTPTILLCHLGMQGAKVGSDYILVADNDISVSDVPQEAFNLCLFGHFHEHQRLFGNGWFIGATHQHNWGDSGGKRGFLHCKVFEDHSIEFEHIEIPGVPKFRKIGHPAEEVEPTRDCDFVRVTVDHVSDSAITSLLEKFPHASLEVIKKVDKQETRLTLSSDQLDPEQALGAWVEEHPHETLAQDELLQLGRKLLREARGG